MKALRIICLALTLVLCLGAMFGCDSSSQNNDNGGNNTGNQTNNNGGGSGPVPQTPAEFLEIPRATQRKLESKYVVINESFTPQSGSDGYVLKATISMKITGYSNDFAYFDSFARVTWTYNIITDAAPGGVRKTFSTDISLDANGCGTYDSTLFFQGCRSAELVDIEYTWTGKITKK